MFENKKLDYAIITIGNKVIEGTCTWWSAVPNGYIKLIVDGKEYLTSYANVLLMEKGE